MICILPLFVLIYHLVFVEVQGVRNYKSYKRDDSYIGLLFTLSIVPMDLIYYLTYGWKIHFYSVRYLSAAELQTMYNYWMRLSRISRNIHTEANVIIDLHR